MIPDGLTDSDGALQLHDTVAGGFAGPVKVKVPLTQGILEMVIVVPLG